MLDSLIIDSSIISESEEQYLEDLERICAYLSSKGVRIGLVATNNKRLLPALKRDVKISFNASLTGEEVFGSPNNKFKGGSSRIEEICLLLDAAPSRSLYLGDDHSDYTSAIHSGAFFIFCEWNGNVGNINCITARNPRGIWNFISHFLLPEPRWSYSIDNETLKFHFRALLNANTLGNKTITLSGNEPFNQFNLIELLKDRLDISCGQYSAASILFWHAVSSAKLEGLIPPYSIASVYPSSTPGDTNPIVSALTESATRAFGGYFRRDLLIRAIPAPKSRQNKREGKDSYLTQSNTVILNPERRDIIRDKTIVVFDDFHTTGKSLDWARNLLIQGGANKVVQIALGKFGGRNYPHTCYIPNLEINPFILKSYVDTDFSEYVMIPAFHQDAAQIIQTSFEKIQGSMPLKEFDQNE